MPGKAKTSVPKKKSAKKSAPKSAPKSTPKAPVEPTPTPATTVVETTENTVENYAAEFTHLLGQLKTLQTTLKELTVYTAKLEKRVAKDQRAVQKRVNGKRRRTNPNASPSGFSKPGPVSAELAKFLKLGKGELIARTEVTKRINSYCKENGLQGKDDKRVLKPDTTLKKLLRLGPKDELTFFNLQKYMKVHFPNKEGVFPTA